MHRRLFVSAEESRPSSLFDFRARTVREIIDWFLTNHAHGSHPKANAERLRQLNLFMAWQPPKNLHSTSRRHHGAFGDWPVNECLPMHLIAFLNTQAGIGSDWTRRRVHTTVNAPFRRAADLGFIDRNPFNGAPMPPQGEDGRDLTDPEFRSLLRKATPAFRRVLLFLRHCGARPGEMSAIVPEEVQIDQRVIVKRKHKTAKKTRKPRKIYLNDVAVRLLQWLLRTATPGQPIFRNFYGRPWKTRALCKNLRQLREAAGLPDDAKLYGCRHAFATALVMNKESLGTVAELLGHSGTATVQRYVHLADKHDHLLAAVQGAVRPSKNGKAPG